jgi:hypothetical protein
LFSQILVNCDCDVSHNFASSKISQQQSTKSQHISVDCIAFWFACIYHYAFKARRTFCTSRIHLSQGKQFVIDNYADDSLNSKLINKHVLELITVSFSFFSRVHCGWCVWEYTWSASNFFLAAFPFFRTNLTSCGWSVLFHNFIFIVIYQNTGSYQVILDQTIIENSVQAAQNFRHVEISITFIS